MTTHLVVWNTCHDRFSQEKAASTADLATLTKKSVAIYRLFPQVLIYEPVLLKNGMPAIKICQ
jgi:hypothetical protein